MTSRYEIRTRLLEAIELPLPTDGDSLGVSGFFDPWESVIEGITASYSSECDELMIQVLEAIRNKSTYELIKKEGFAAEFMIYVLTGHGMVDYGTSPRYGWPAPEIEDLWQPLIDKWKAYYEIAWPED